MGATRAIGRGATATGGRALNGTLWVLQAMLVVQFVAGGTPAVGATGANVLNLGAGPALPLALPVTSALLARGRWPRIGATAGGLKR